MRKKHRNKERLTKIEVKRELEGIRSKGWKKSRFRDVSTVQQLECNFPKAGC